MNQYKFTLRIATITLFILIYYAGHAIAFDLDLTVEDDIRKNYNSSKLVNDTNTQLDDELPELPSMLKNEDKNNSGSAVKQKNINLQQNTTVYKKTGSVKMSKGTVFQVVNLSKISDWQKPNTIVKFRTTDLINKRGYSLPSNTVFIGEIIESHQPQISCNGGLVVIRIQSLIYKGQSVPLKGYIIKADSKMIFLNNIKGERTYLKTVWKKGNWGRNLFNRMLTLTINLGGDGSTFLLSPFPLAYGTICLGANTIISPVTAFFQKGKHVSINAGSKFKIKLLEDAYID